MRRLLCAITIASGLVLAAPRSAPAQERSKQEQVRALNQEAKTAFESYNFKKARRRLGQALSIARRAGLGKNPVVAKTYVLMGVAYVAGSNDLYRGLHYFVRAIRLNPKAAIPRTLATPQLLQMFKTARQTVRAVGIPPTITLRQEKRPERPAASNAGRRGRGLVHNLIDTAKRGYPIPVKAEAGLDVQAHRLYLFYRPAGTVKFFRLPMKKTVGVFRASVPANATHGRYVHYYIQAVDQRGRLAASMGSARSPNVVIIN